MQIQLQIEQCLRRDPVIFIRLIGRGFKGLD